MEWVIIVVAIAVFVLGSLLPSSHDIKFLR